MNDEKLLELFGEFARQCAPLGFRIDSAYYKPGKGAIFTGVYAYTGNEPDGPFLSLAQDLHDSPDAKGTIFPHANYKLRVRVTNDEDGVVTAVVDKLQAWLTTRAQEIMDQ